MSMPSLYGFQRNCLRDISIRFVTAVDLAGCWHHSYAPLMTEQVQWPLLVTAQHSEPYRKIWVECKQAYYTASAW